MTTRYLYIARHGDADAFGDLTDIGREQARLLGERLAHVPIATVWHSPLARAAATARELSARLSHGVAIAEAGELIDHIPYVPTADETPRTWVPFFDGYDEAEAAAGYATSQSLISRFGSVADPGDKGDVHELLITHAYPIAWLLRDALDAPHARWLGLDSANAALTVIEHRPGLPPGLVMFNDMSHLPSELRWTGFPSNNRP